MGRIQSFNILKGLVGRLGAVVLSLALLAGCQSSQLTA